MRGDSQTGARCDSGPEGKRAKARLLTETRPALFVSLLFARIRERFRCRRGSPRRIPVKQFRDEEREDGIARRRIYQHLPVERIESDA